MKLLVVCKFYNSKSYIVNFFFKINKLLQFNKVRVILKGKSCMLNNNVDLIILTYNSIKHMFKRSNIDCWPRLYYMQLIES